MEHSTGQAGGHLRARLRFGYSLPAAIESGTALIDGAIQVDGGVWKADFADGFVLYAWQGAPGWTPTGSERWRAVDTLVRLPRARTLSVNAYGISACAELYDRPRVRGLLDGQGATIDLAQSEVLIVDTAGTPLLSLHPGDW